MKFRHYMVIFGGILLSILVFGIGAIATYQPNQYKFLGSSGPKKTTLEQDPVGLVGREVRYYVVPNAATSVAADARDELSKIGWTQVGSDPVVFSRGDYERIDVRSADQYNDKRLLAGIPPSEVSNHTVIKVVDPRLSPAIRQRFSRIARRVRNLHGKHIG